MKKVFITGSTDGISFMAAELLTEDGLPHVFAINSLAPHLPTCLINKPKSMTKIPS